MRSLAGDMDAARALAHLTGIGGWTRDWDRWPRGAGAHAWYSAELPGELRGDPPERYLGRVTVFDTQVELHAIRLDGEGAPVGHPGRDEWSAEIDLAALEGTPWADFFAASGPAPEIGDETPSPGL